MTKINCAKCLEGNCKDCIDESCLCRESHKKKCVQCGKNSVQILGDSRFCSSDCAINWTLKSPEATKEEYNDSSKVQALVVYLKHHKVYRDIIPAFQSSPGMTFNFDVLPSPILTHWFNESPEDFPMLVKSALVKSFLDYGYSAKTAEVITERSKVVITEAHQIKVNEWSAKHEGIPLQVECQIISAGLPETYTKYAEAYCTECKTRKQIISIGSPPKCGVKTCGMKFEDMTVDWTTVKTGDVQMFQIQEPIDQAKHGTPASFPCLVKDDYVKNTFVGQRKKLIGVFRSQVQKGKMTNSILINAISLMDLDDVKDTPPNPEEIRYFETLLKKENFLETITESIAPELKHERLAKLCVLLSILGGNHAGRLRGDIHTMLTGSPSSGKSTLLEFVPMIVQKSGFANGSTMSGTGVTVAMDTLPNRQKMPRAGIIPLCTGGVVAIDEMNQLSEEDIAKMFEAMESGKIHYNKGGFDLTLDARTTIISGANPKGYEYDWNASMMDNLSFMPMPMISRFDLITHMTSEKTELEEDEIQDHILEIRRIGVEEYVKRNNLLTPHQLTLFLNYAKTFHPISDKSTDKVLKDFTKAMRKIQIKDRGMKRVDKRFFEAMIRLATAVAKVHLSKTVTESHAILAIEIFKQTLQSFRIDTSDGISIPKQETLVTSKKAAFERGLQRISAESEDRRFEEADAIKRICEFYPQYFTPETAQKLFDEYYNKGKLGKQAGRYRLQ